MSDYKFLGGIEKPWITFDDNATALERTAVRGVRNGLPGVKPYVWRPGESRRDAEVARLLAGIRAKISTEGEA